VEIGEWERARRLCEKLLSYASALGLYGEELDPDTGRHLGNFPQAFTHLALINAVMHVIHAERGTVQRTNGESLSPPPTRTRRTEKTAREEGGNGVKRPVEQPAHAEPS
jgi:hypothetical protein